MMSGDIRRLVLAPRIFKEFAGMFLRKAQAREAKTHESFLLSTLSFFYHKRDFLLETNIEASS
jgi:hypothetical protein